MHPIFSTQNKSCECKDDPSGCKFRACDPASLLRHRKSQHGYIPRARPSTSTDGQSSMAPTQHSSIDSSSSDASGSSISVDPFLEFNSILGEPFNLNHFYTGILITHNSYLIYPLPIHRMNNLLGF